MFEMILNILAGIAFFALGFLLAAGLFALVGKVYISFLQDLRNYQYDKRVHRFRSHSS